tara:strand:+ start:44 stop:823 length:780 start_codon:yes stop_codon:yes gene_type:complete
VYLFKNDAYRLIFNLSFYLLITVYFALALQYPDIFLAEDFSSFIGMVFMGFLLLYVRSKILSVFPQPSKPKKKLKYSAQKLREKMESDRAKRLKSPAIIVGPPPSLAGPPSEGVMQFSEVGIPLPPPEGGGVRKPDGSVVYPDGKTVGLDGTTTHTDGRVEKADGTVIHPDGRIDVPPSEELEEEEPELAEGEMQIEEGQSLEDIKAKMNASKPKKPKIDVSMLDTSSSYDDKVVLMRMLVNEDTGKVAQVLKKMISAN